MLILMTNEAIEMDEIEEVHHQQENRDHAFNEDVSASEDDNSSSVSIKNMAQGGHEVIEVDDAVSSIAESDKNEETAEESVTNESEVYEFIGDDKDVDNVKNCYKNDETIELNDSEADNEEDQEVDEVIIWVDQNTTSSIGETWEKQGNENKRTAEESAATAKENVGDEDVISVEDDDDDGGTQDEVVSSEDDEVVSEKTFADENDHKPSDDDRESSDCKIDVDSGKAQESEVYEIIDDYEYQDVDSVKNGYKNDEAIDIINSEADDEESNEVMIIDCETPKEDGRIEKRRRSSELEFFELDTVSIKKKVKRCTDGDTPRQSVRNLTKETKSYKLDEDEPVRYSHRSSEESYTEEIAAENPVAFNIGELEVRKIPALALIPQTLSPTPAKLIPSTSTTSFPVTPAHPTSMTESPELTDNMFVIKAASLVVPCLNQKPPGTEFKTFLNEIHKQAGKQQKKETEQKNGGDNDDAMEIDDGEKVRLKNFNCVQECVQSDWLSEQKQKLDREERNPDTNKVIRFWLKNLEYNEHLKKPLKKCEYCDFKTASLLVLANHLETQHTKNGEEYDIVSHMKADHGVRGRLEPVAAFCKRPNVNHKSEASSITIMGNTMIDRTLSMIDKQAMAGGSVLATTNYHLTGNEVDQQQSQGNKVHQPSGSMIQPTRHSATSSAYMASAEPSDMNSKNLELRWIHEVDKIIFVCPLCQSIFYTEQDLELHLLISHGLVSSSMEDAFKNRNDADVCPVCEDYHFKLLNHVALDHGMTLKPVNLSYECTICAATFGVYNQFEHHVYSDHILVAKQAMNKKVPLAAESVGDSLLKPLSINDEITLIPAIRTSISEVDSLATPRDVKYPEMPYSCRKCKCRFVTNQDLECHLLGSHGLVTSRMQDAADKNKDFGICQAQRRDSFTSQASTSEEDSSPTSRGFAGTSKSK